MKRGTSNRNICQKSLMRMDVAGLSKHLHWQYLAHEQGFSNWWWCRLANVQSVHPENYEKKCNIWLFHMFEMEISHGFWLSEDQILNQWGLNSQPFNISNKTQTWLQFQIYNQQELFNKFNFQMHTYFSIEV